MYGCIVKFGIMVDIMPRYTTKLALHKVQMGTVLLGRDECRSGIRHDDKLIHLQGRILQKNEEGDKEEMSFDQILMGWKEILIVRIKSERKGN